MPRPTPATGASPAPNPVHARFAGFEIDQANAILLQDGKPVAVAPTPFALLCALVRQPGALLTKNALLDEVWGHQFVSESVLKTAISDLRTLLGDDARQPRFIETVSRRGYRFIASPSAVAAVPVAAGHELRSTQAHLLIGRQDAIARLRRAWHAACEGARAMVWIAGEPGIGKTTLIDHFVDSLGTDVATARGQCVENFGSGEPYLPVLEALSGLARRDAAVPALLRGIAPTWLLQMPWLSTPDERAALQRELAGVSPDRMLREMGELLDRYAAERPALLVTEDLHWSDRSTIQLMDFMARRRGAAKLMWLASFRLTEVVALDHPLNRVRHELRLHRLCEEIVLDSFSEAEVAEFVAGTSPSLSSDEAFVRALHTRTDGVPLFVSSILNEVMAHPGSERDVEAAAGLAQVAVPDNLAGVIDHHIASLGQEERQVLAAGAVCGVEFRVATVARAIERDAAWVSEVCGKMARDRIWLTAPRGYDVAEMHGDAYAFRHALFRQVLYDRTAHAQRAQLHRRIGSALESERAAGTSVPLAELAVHFERAGDAMKALRHFAEAADSALVRLSPAECLATTGHALDILDSAPADHHRHTIEISLATLHGIAATQALGMGSEAKSSLRRAYSLLDRVPEHPMRGRLLHGLGLVLSLRTEYDEALEVASHAERLWSATGDRAFLLASAVINGEVQQLQGRSTALASIERGLAADDPAGPGPMEPFVIDPRVTLLGLLAIQLLYQGRIGRMRECLGEALARARDLRQPMARLSASWFEALVEVRLGDAARVAAIAADMGRLVDEFGVAQGRAACRAFRAWADARAGKPRDAFAELRGAYEESARLGMLAGGSETRGYAAEALLLAGDWLGAQRELDQALAFAQARGERVYLVQLRCIEAAIARARGGRGAGHAPLRQAVAHAREQEAPWLEIDALAQWCEHGDAAANDFAALAGLVERLPEAADTPPVIRAKRILAARQAA